ncbi:HAD family hydrolase [Sphingomonas sp. EC-HK361]|uniref:HAD family hydrolase n=1 Tax=Sphingomonas sp. EC-HK361 TaxID=2038397 RepID=UPI00125A1D23|nr:HAD family hydrolase [Sphingomonas sp. EC-HK361]VVT24465.1 HAD family hydrolase [Sphingomonas sp. EC-HK361]
MPIDLICLDADDTLWHNMRFFDRAEQAIVAMLEPFADAGLTREAMARTEGRNLSLYGYGAKSFTLSMIEVALELGGDDLPVSAVRDILAAGRDLLAHPVELLEDIEATLTALAARGRLVLVTKGDLFHQEAKLAASGLGERFAAVEIVSDKSAETFERLFARHGVDPARAMMAGDSMRSDVLPALTAGAWAAFIPQPLAWSHEVAEAPADAARFRQLSTLAELPGWIDSIG